MKVLTEDETIDAALSGRSLARYGDGEMKLVLGKDCISQKTDPALTRELREILKASPAMVCIPNPKNAKPKVWDQYFKSPYAGYYEGTYGSAFITRPDNAPWIDRPDYWAKVKALWEGRDVTLVVGSDRSLTPAMMAGALSVREVWGPRTSAYVELQRIEDEVGTPDGIVLICLGAAGTCLAHRLAKKGVWAVDAGHIGMFLKHAGAWSFDKAQLISDGYRDQNKALHARPEGYGGGGYKQLPQILAFIKERKPTSLLDYGCGQGTLKRVLREQWTGHIAEYDPAIEGKDALPKPAEMVACTDVLEHVEPERLDAVLTHLARLTSKWAYVTIATRPANKTLPDGRNAHLILESEDWWTGRLAEKGFFVLKSDAKPGYGVTLWLAKS